MRLENLDLRPEKADFRPERPGLRPKRLDLRPERLDFRPKRLDLRPERPDLRSQRSDLRTEGPDEGGGWTNERMKVSLRSTGLRPLRSRCPKMDTNITDIRVEVKCLTSARDFMEHYLISSDGLAVLTARFIESRNA